MREEVGIEIKDLRYVGSQGWPFPDQLMLGFRAEYESGDIRVQESELVEAKWFTKDALPPFPKRGSMGRRRKTTCRRLQPNIFGMRGVTKKGILLTPVTERR